MSTEVVADQHHDLRIRVVHLKQLLDLVSPVYGGPAFPDVDLPTSGQGLEEQEIRGCASEQLQRPAATTFRRLAAGQGDQASFLFAVQNRFDGRSFPLLPLKGCVEPLEHKALANAFRGIARQ